MMPLIKLWARERIRVAKTSAEVETYLFTRKINHNRDLARRKISQVDEESSHNSSSEMGIILYDESPLLDCQCIWFHNLWHP